MYIKFHSDNFPGISQPDLILKTGYRDTVQELAKHVGHDLWTEEKLEDLWDPSELSVGVIVVFEGCR